MAKQRTLRTCPEGHTFYKSSDCLTCPTCAQSNKPETGFLSTLASPARSALTHAGITTPEILSEYTEKDILKLHGIGKASLPALHRALAEAGLSFKSKEVTRP